MDLYVVTVNDCGELIKQLFYKHAFFTSYIHDTNKRQIHVNYYTVESIIHKSSIATMARNVNLCYTVRSGLTQADVERVAFCAI